MASFGAKASSAVEAEDKTPKPDFKQVAADEGRKPVKQAGSARGLPTPESTPGPDIARLQADKARRGAEVAKAPNATTKDSPSGTDTAGVTVEEGKDSANPSQTAMSSEEPPDDASDEDQRTYTDEQKNAVNRVLKCEPNKYYRILEVKDPSSKEDIKKAYKKLSLLLHPDKNKYEGSEEAFKRKYTSVVLFEAIQDFSLLSLFWLHNIVVATAAKALGVESEDFAENAYENEDGADDDNDAMNMEQSEAPKPDDFRKKIYAEATTYLGKLMTDPKDAEAKLELEKLNKQIKEQNIKDGLPKEDLQNFLIQVPTFVSNFELAQGYYKALEKNPDDDIARQKLSNINDMLGQLNQRHGYPETWFIAIPDRSGPNGAESSKVTASKNGDQAEQASSRGGVKTKVGVPIPDESNGRTSLEKVVNVKKAGFGSRVIVNRGTEQNPYFEIYPEAEFGKGVAKQWLENGTYECEDLLKDTEARRMQIYGRVKVKRTSRKPENKAARTQSEIQYYLIKVGDEDYISTRSTLSGMKELSPTKLKRIDVQLNHQNEQLLTELDNCREQNEHPDTEEQLTKADIEEMPWLSPDTIRQTENEKDERDNDDDEDIGNIVPQRAGLKRNAKPKDATRTPEPSVPRRASVESELWVDFVGNME